MIFESSPAPSAPRSDLHLANRRVPADVGRSHDREYLALVGRARDGDHAAQSELVTRYRFRVTRFVETIVWEREVHEDIAQTVMIRMVRRLPRLREPALFESWLFRMARNEALDFIRRARCRPRLVGKDWDWSMLADTRDDSGHRELYEALEYALQFLTASQRKIIMLVVAGYSHAAIGKMIGVSRAAVKLKVFRLRRDLRARVREALGEG